MNSYSREITGMNFFFLFILYSLLFLSINCIPPYINLSYCSRDFYTDPATQFGGLIQNGIYMNEINSVCSHCAILPLYRFTTQSKFQLIPDLMWHTLCSGTLPLITSHPLGVGGAYLLFYCFR